jgi:integrase
MPARIKTLYPGIYFRTKPRKGRHGIERVYYAVYKLNGKTVETKVGCQYRDGMTPARAARIRGQLIEGKRLTRKEIREKIEAEKQAMDERWTIDRLWNEYKDRNPHLKGWKTYICQYDLHIKSTFGDKEPSDILPLDIDRHRLRLLSKRSPQTVSHVLKLLKRVVKFGAENGFCSNFPFIIKIPTVDNKKTENLTDKQLKRLLEAIEIDNHPHAGPMMKMALYTGMRRGEMFRLKWQDIDFEHGSVHIRDPKGGPDQVIPLSQPARALLESHPRTSKFVFPGRGGRQRMTIAKHVNKIKEAAALPKGFRPLHGLRHVFASLMASSGKVDMYTLQKLLTHKDPAMTQRYAHLKDETLKRAADVAGDIFGNVTEVRNGKE